MHSSLNILHVTYRLYQMYFEIKFRCIDLLITFDCSLVALFNAKTYVYISIQQRMTRILTSNISTPLTATKLLGEYALFSICFK